jgi:thiol-disulfide isomerase/thioredoxin
VHRNRIYLNRILPALILIVVPSATAQDSKETKVALEGQLVCSVCWLEADRKTTPYGNAADIECAKDCTEKGIPPAIAVKEADNFKLYVIEEGRFKKPGKDWLDYIGKQVKVSGRAHDEKEKHYLRVDELSVIPSPENGQDALIGTEAELTLKDLFGVEQKLSAFRGRLVVLNFWATWCIPCRKEMPDLAAIQNEFAAFGVQVVGASADQMGDRARVIQFVKDTKINFPVWLGATTEDMRRMGVGPGLPATAIIGRDGKILAIHHSVIRQAELKKQLDQLLASDSPAVVREAVAARQSSRDVSLVPS